MDIQSASEVMEVILTPVEKSSRNILQLCVIAQKYSSMEIRFTLEEPLKSKVLARMIRAGKTSARAVVLEILKESFQKSSSKKSKS